MRVAFIDDDPNELKILHTYFNDLTDPSTILLMILKWRRIFVPLYCRTL